MSRGQSGDNLYNVAFCDGANYRGDIIRSAFEDKHLMVVGFDDFHRQYGAAQANSPWVGLSGTDAQAVDPQPLSTQVAEGVIRLTCGNASGTYAADASQLVADFPVRTDYGQLYVEARVKLSAITNVSAFFGLTDSQALEEPVSISAATYTTNASDAAIFVFDTAATTDEWHCVAVDSDTDDTDSGASGTAPVATTYQRLGILLDNAGDELKFYINGALVKTLDGGGVSNATDLFITLGINSTTTSSRNLDCDYIYWRHSRPM